MGTKCPVGIWVLAISTVQREETLGKLTEGQPGGQGTPGGTQSTASGREARCETQSPGGGDGRAGHQQRPTWTRVHLQNPAEEPLPGQGPCAGQRVDACGEGDRQDTPPPGDSMQSPQKHIQFLPKYLDEKKKEGVKGAVRGQPDQAVPAGDSCVRSCLQATAAPWRGMRTLLGH